MASRNDKELCYTGYKTFDTNNKSAQVEIDTRGRTMFFTITQSSRNHKALCYQTYMSQNPLTPIVKSLNLLILDLHNKFKF